MKKFLLYACIAFLFSCQNNHKEQQKKQKGDENEKSDLIMTTLKKTLQKAQQHYKAQLKQHTDSEKIPATIDTSGNVQTVTADNWVSGFFPGTLWYLYEYTNDDFWKKNAEKWTAALSDEQYNTTTHDLGFMIFCSFGNGYKNTKANEYKNIIIQSAKSLCTRYNHKTGCIRSWDFNGWWEQYPVIIDNMMNLEMLLWAAKNTNDTIFSHVADKHAITTLNNHFRDDFSSYHVVDYDTLTGKALRKGTFQGYADNSSWARGQAWALYGYTMMYRETGNNTYLKQAENIADYCINNLPDDYIPYWDFDAPDIPNTPRDASAATVMASALIELSQLTDKKKYLTTAENILMKLASPDYVAKPNTNGNFLLMHSVVSKPHNAGVDVPLNYADYYFIEAALRYLQLNS